MPKQVLVSYSYYEKDVGQRENFRFFISAGMGIRANGHDMPIATDFSIVISGAYCAPCDLFRGLVQEQRCLIEGATALWENSRVAVLHRIENEGMDFAAHNVRPHSSMRTVLHETKSRISLLIWFLLWCHMC